MTPEAEKRLSAYVGRIVGAGSVPAADREDVAEEMLGHLLERVEAAVASGMDEDAAVRTAIAGFGDVADVGAEFGRTYHSRLWASSVGVLLAARDAPGERPGVIGGLRALLAISVAFAAVGAVVAFAELTPTHALLAAAACLGFVAAGTLAYRALNIGLRWSVGFALGTAAALVYEGAVPRVPSPPGTTTIPVLAIAAAMILVWALASAEQVGRFVAGSSSIGRPLALALALTAVLPTLSARALPAIPDPTQATADDASLGLSMACGRRFDAISGHERQYATVSADVSFRRTDLFPLGLAGQLDSSDAADAAGFRLLDSEPILIENGGQRPSWLLDDDGVAVRVADSDEVAGWFGASSSSVTMLPDTIGSFTVGIDQERIAANRTIRISWTIIPTEDGEQAWPRADVAFAHLTRFLVSGTVACGEHVQGAPVPGARPHPQRGGFLSG